MHSPERIEKWPSCDYILFVDESGTKNIFDFGDYPILVLCGCLLRRDAYQRLINNLLELKREFWPPDGMYSHKRICLVSNYIRQRKGPFGPRFLSDERKNLFYEALNHIITDTSFEIIASIIDKKALVTQYVYPASPYNLAFAFMIERLVMHLSTQNEKGIIVIERRGGKEDAELLTTFNKFKANGTSYISGNKLRSRIQGLYFLPKWNAEGKTYPGLELADLCGYPLGSWYLGHFCKTSEIVERKLRNYPRYNGYGLKTFP